MADPAAFMGLFAGFVRDAISSGAFAPFLSDTSTPSAPAPTPPPAPAPQPAPAPPPTLAVPPVRPYTSTRALALPAAVTGHPLPSIPSTLGTIQPMLGLPGLEISTVNHSNNARTRNRNQHQVLDLTTREISEANKCRRAASAAHLGPSGSAFQVRQRRRGPAIRSPVLHQGPQTALERVSSLDPAGVREIRVTHMIQAFQPKQEVVLYKNFAEAFHTYLNEHGLCFDYALPADTRVLSILDRSAASMRTGPHRYTFGDIPSGPSTRHRHESLDLQILGLVNKGNMRVHSSTSHLRREAIPSTLTLINLFDKIHSPLYVIPSVSIHEGRLVLHSNPSPRPGWNIIHSCLTKRQNKQFKGEATELNFTDNDPYPDSDTSGGVPDEDETEDEDEDIPAAPPLTAAIAPLPSCRSSHASSTPIPSRRLPSRISHARVGDCSRVIASAVPTQTTPAPWGAAPFETLLGPYGNLFDQRDVAKAVYQAAGNNVRLELKAESLEELAMLYGDVVCEGLRMNDFSHLLSANRCFEILNPNGSVRSFGPGLEREAIYAALNIYFKNSGCWCLMTDEGRMSLAMSTPLCLASAAPSGRLQNFKIFGALVALSLISGRPPGPLSPALLQYALNDCDLCALTPSFVTSWNPSLDRAARSMQAVGPTGDLMQFQSEIITYLNIQVATLSIRDQTFHNMLVNQLVHTGLLGPDLHSHPEAAVFCTGLELPGVNGFTFSKFARSYPGGTEFYLANAWTSCITDYAALEPHLPIASPSPVQCLPHFGPLPPGLNPETELVRFLKDTGNPSGDRLEASKSHFTEAVIGEMKNIDLPSYCPSMLCWAATGSPFLEPDADPADPNQADFVLPDDLGYSDDPATSAYAMAQGLISFHTCSRFARIPMSKLINLHNTTYPTQDDTSFEDAVDGWLLLQILNAIGKSLR
ncbi:hypothetical protein DFH09DRAFT_1456837 [Mycena vulgaris]|nr:hypothetical protein DFH09DRAFT_1456837 [Mycena vulgaris]